MLRPGLCPLIGLLTLVAGVPHSSPVAAQDSPRPPVTVPATDSSRETLRGFSMGVTLDRYLIASYGATAVSLRGLNLSPSHWGSEFGFGLLPVEGTSNMAMIVDLGTAYQTPSTGSVVMIKLGSTGIYGGNGGLVGLYGGVGIVGRIAKGLVIRMDVTRRWFLAPGELPQIWLVSVGVASLTTKH